VRAHQEHKGARGENLRSSLLLAEGATDEQSQAAIVRRLSGNPEDRMGLFKRYVVEFRDLNELYVRRPT